MKSGYWTNWLNNIFELIFGNRNLSDLQQPLLGQEIQRIPFVGIADNVANYSRSYENVFGELDGLFVHCCRSSLKTAIGNQTDRTKELQNTVCNRQQEKSNAKIILFFLC